MATAPASTEERVTALNVIARALGDELCRGKIEDARLRQLCCAILGHPKLVHTCLGEISCARCNAVVGDTISRADSLKERAIVGHDCINCRALCTTLTENDRLMLPETARAYVAAMTTTTKET